MTMYYICVCVCLCTCIYMYIYIYMCMYVYIHDLNICAGKLCVSVCKHMYESVYFMNIRVYMYELK